jgi:HPt (histidine-containing phosphotransfer) domain-containing protein
MMELIEGFLAELGERVHEIEKAAEQSDLNALAVLSHKLKGAGGGYGYAPITEAARALEHHARHTRDVQAIGQALAELKDLCLRARAGSKQEQAKLKNAA